MLRFASFWLFLDAFHIGGSFDNVLLVMCVQAITGALPFTPGGAGAQQALLVVALNGPTYAAVLAYSVGQQIAVTVWSVAIAFITLGLVFRAWDLRRPDPRGPSRARRPEAGDLTALSPSRTRRGSACPSSLVPSRRSSASSACSSGSSTNEKRSRTRIVADLVLGDHGALGQRPAQVLLADPAALAAVDEQLHVPVVGLGRRASRARSALLGARRWSRRRGRGACSIRSSGGSHSPIEVFASRSIRGDLVALLRGDEGDRAAGAPDPARCGRSGARRSRWCSGTS